MRELANAAEASRTASRQINDSLAAATLGRIHQENS